MGPCSCVPRGASRTARSTVTGAWCENVRKPRRSRGAASSAVSGRDQRQPALGLVPIDRGVAGGFGFGADGAVCGGSGGAGAGLRGGSDQRQGSEPAPSAAVGCVLVGADLVGSVESGSVLGSAAAAKPPGHPLAGRIEDAGVLPVDRSGQRVAVAPALVTSTAPCGICSAVRWVLSPRTRYTAVWTNC